MEKLPEYWKLAICHKPVEESIVLVKVFYPDTSTTKYIKALFIDDDYYEWIGKNQGDPKIIPAESVHSWIYYPSSVYSKVERTGCNPDIPMEAHYATLLESHKRLREQVFNLKNELKEVRQQLEDSDKGMNPSLNSRTKHKK